MKISQDGQSYFVELYDIGGNPRFRSTRSLFYDGIEGFIFVWDCSMEATFHSLDSWLQEIKVIIWVLEIFVDENFHH